MSDIYVISEDMLKIWRASCTNIQEPHTNNETCKGCKYRGKGNRRDCCDFDDDDMEEIFRSRPLSSELKAERKRMLEKVVKILAAHTINSDDFKQDHINEGWILVGGYEPIMEELESLRSEQP